MLEREVTEAECGTAAAAKASAAHGGSSTLREDHRKVIKLNRPESDCVITCAMRRPLTASV